MSRPASSRSFLAFAASRRPLKCQQCLGVKLAPSRQLQTDATTIPLRKQLKDEAKARKLNKSNAPKKGTESDDKWELTVGIEIHAELSTARKLFSPARTSLSDTPNTHVSMFDAALPGSQPQFQTETLLPALRAALAFGCDIQETSSWDRKHYFHWDQPQGYQITQYYSPFALGGSVTLYAHDDIDPADAPSITIGLKQIQMEQDTAKTILQPPHTHLIDFNRVSHPLIEIITLPQLHRPRTAAALVRKIQATLKAVGANTTGMEMGGLRADVNVSVRRRDGTDAPILEYAGVTGLGQRTEIKNLSSFKAVEEAIVAERDRQIGVLEAGGEVQGETRGWTLGSSETRRLRGKEGEVDYRYMPDPDLGVVRIGRDLLTHLRATLPTLPDALLAHLTTPPTHALTLKDAKTLVALDDGDRLDYYLCVLASLPPGHGPAAVAASRAAANFALHDIGALQTTHGLPFSNMRVPAPTLAALLALLLAGEITAPTAKALLARAFVADEPWAPADVASVVDAEGLRVVALSDAEYDGLADKALRENEGMCAKIRAEPGGRGVQGKVMWFVGRVMQGEGRGPGVLRPERVEEAVRRGLGI